MSSVSCESRIGWIDNAKTVTIFLVVFGHCLQILYSSNYIAKDIFDCIYSFHMSVFFFLSGYVYSADNKMTIIYLRKKFNRLIIPAYLFGALWILYSLLKHDIQLRDISLIFILNNLLLLRNSFIGRYWFLPTLFSLLMLKRILTKLGKLEYIIVIVLFISNISQRSVIDLRLPFCVEIACLALPFFYCGIILKKNTIPQIKNSYSVILVVCSLFILWIFRENPVAMFNNSCPSVLSYIISGGVGIVLIIIFSTILPSGFFEFLGKHTLEIYGLHFIGFIGLFQKLLRVDKISNYYIAIISCVIVALLIIFTISILVYLYHSAKDTFQTRIKKRIG